MIFPNLTQNQKAIRLVFSLLVLLLLNLSISTFAQKADFHANSTEGCNSLSVQFFDDSEGATSWEWDFGNGNISTLQNPKANYTNSGFYNVKLTINGNLSAEKLDFIKVYNNPVPNFTSDLTSGCVPLEVQFEDKTAPVDGAIESWVWLINGSSISEKNTGYTFDEPGSYKITLMAVDEHGCYGNASKAKYITVSKVPEVNFTITGDMPCELPYQPTITNQTTIKDIDEPFVYINNWEWKINDKVVSNNQELSYSFEENDNYTISLSAQMGACTDSFRVDDAIILSVDTLDYTIEREGPRLKDSVIFKIKNQDLSYVEWNLGDGFKTNEKQFKYCYADSGKYKVSISAILNNGCHLYRTANVGVLPSPVASYTFKRQNVCKPPFAVKFTNSSKMTEHVLWDFGDGGSSTSDTSVVHSFNSTGDYTIKLIAYGKGDPDTLVKTISLSQPGGITIIPSRDKGCIPLNVEFNTGGTLKDVHWDFDDGEESTLQTPQHTYSKEGTYNVTLSYTNNQGCPVSSTAIIQGGDKPVVNFQINQTDSCNRSPVELINLSTNYQTEEWYIGDYSERFKVDESGSYNFHFNSPGNKPVELALDNFGCTTTLKKDNAVYINPPVAFFFMDNPLCEFPAQSNIQNYSQGYDEISWNFGDGTQQKDTPSYHTFESSGMFNVYQTVNNKTTSCKDYYTQYVHVSKTEPNFELTGINEGCLPFSVSFIDRSTTTGTIHRWYWDFGDGIIDTTRIGEVTHVYTTPGVFDVKLTVEERFGCRETIVKQNAVVVNYTQADIGFLKDTVCVNETFELTDQSHSNTNIVSHNWFFPSGKTEASSVVQHQYSLPGNKDAILLVTDEKGCVNSDTLHMNVPIVQSLFIVGNYTCTNNELQVENISLGEELSYTWNFGDGETSEEKEPNHIYNSDGIYDISLITTNKNGCTDNTIQSINAVTPVVDFDAYKTELGCARNALPAVFYDHSSEDIYQWQWDFGDDNGAIAQNKNPQYLYTLPGYYDVKLTVTSKGGCTRELVKEDFIHLTGPVGSITTDVSAGCIPLTVQYSTQTDANNKISWDVGDGTNHYDDQMSFSHTYNESRSFFPSIILTDQDGCTMEYDGDPIIVDSYPDLTFTASQTDVCAGTELDIDGNINLKSSQFSQISEIIWDFGDTQYNSYNSSTTHTYYTPGTYDVELYVKTSIGCSASLKKENYITVFPSTLNANFSTSKDKACLGESILFTDESQSDYPVTQHKWNFNDKDFSTSSPVNYIYTEGGSFDAKLTVVDQKGCIDSTSTSILISNIDAAFTVDPVSGYAPLNAIFTEQTTSDSQLVLWNWNFGDNTTSDERNPTHSYSGDNGQTTFFPSLTVTDNNHCSSTVTDTIYAINFNPEALNDTISVKEDNVGYGNMATNDMEPDGQQLIYSSATLSGPAHGTVSIQSSGLFTYTPNSNYFGTDEFEYQVCDNGIPEACASAKVVIEVLSVDDIAPVAVVDHFEINEKETLTEKNVLLNDIDSEGVGLNVLIDNPKSVALHGNIILNVDGNFSYTPEENYTGKDSVQYVIFDNGNPSQRDSSWIIIHILAVEEPPVAVTDYFYTDEEVPIALSNLANNDTDPENNIDPKTVNIAEPVTNGTLSFINDEYLYTPEKDFFGTVYLEYSIGDMSFLSDTGEIIIEVKQVNDAPMAFDDYANGYEDVPLEISVLSNDTDVDNNLNASNFKLLSAEVSNQVSFDNQNGILTYYPSENYIGTDILNYEICDSLQLCSQAKIFINLQQSFDDAPITQSDTLWVIQSLNDTADVVSNDTDPENDLDKSAVYIVTYPESYPDVTVLDDGRILVDYLSNPDFIGQDSLVYQVCDERNNCAEEKLYIIVKPYKDALFIPQAITPNGDGKNDLFEIKNINRFPYNRLYVYNRWEHEVYSKKGYNNTWDGTLNNKPLPDGTYYYLLYLVDGDEPIKGFVYISR